MYNTNKPKSLNKIAKNLRETNLTVEIKITLFLGTVYFNDKYISKMKEKYYLCNLDLDIYSS